MRKLTLWMQSSTDGRISGPNGEFDWPQINDELTTYFTVLSRSFGCLMYGRKVYEMMAGYWPIADTLPSATDYDRFYSAHWRETPKVVFSRTLQKADWDTEIVRDDVVGAVDRLKSQSGADIAFFGGAETAAVLIENGLVDDYRIFVHPVVLGGGPRLFPDLGERAGLTLAESVTFGNGVVHLHYTA